MSQLILSLYVVALLLIAHGAVASSPEARIAELQALRDSDPAALLERIEREQVEMGSDTDPRYLAHQFRLRAEVLRNRGEYTKARQDAIEFQRHAEALGDPLLLSRALVLHGSLEAEQSNIADALEYFHQARRLLEASDRADELARVNNAIGVAHNFTHDYARARHYYEVALRLARAAGDTVLEGTALGNLALTVSEIDGPEAGLLLHYEAMALAEQRGDLQGAAIQKANICQRLMQANQPDKARITCLEALNQTAEQQLSRPLAGVRMTLGDLSRHQGALREAIAHYSAGLAEAQGTVPRVELMLRRHLSEVYDALGEPLSALRQLQAMVVLHEELTTRERQTLVEELEAHYKLEQHERQLELLTLDAALQRTRLHQRTQMLLTAGIALMLAMLVALIAWRGYHVKVRLERKLALRNKELEVALEKIGNLARTDPLTGLWNRRAFEEIALREMARATRTQQPMTLAVADIDNFKPLNDRHGHMMGDKVLKAVAKQLQEVLRDADVICRWGGEEFLCLLPDVDVTMACQAMQRVRQRLAAQPIQVAGELFQITMTFGIAALHGDLIAAINAADMAMYEGKRAGRNRIVVANDANHY